MKKINLPVIILLILSGFNITTSGYVLQCPGTEHFNTYQNMTFSDCVNSSYFEFGPDYFWLSNMNFTVESITSNFYSYNLSFFNDTLDNHTYDEMPYRFFEFNGSFSDTGAFDFIMDLPHSWYLIDFYADNTLMYSDVDETSGLYRFPYNFTAGTSTMFTFYIDGYRPTCPSNASVTYDGPSNTFNFTWYNTSGADTFVLVNNTDDYPSTPTDGTVVQNNSWTYYNATLTETAYFSLWVYNNSGRYSSNSCKLDFTWGAITIQQVYNESNPSQIISPFGLLISNQSGTQTYWESTAYAPLYISKDSIPYGTNTLITINASGYKTTNFYYDFITNNFYNLTFYIPPEFTVVGPGGGDEGDPDDTHLTTRDYPFRVIDQYFYPIADVKANIKFYNNLTETWENKSIALTDGNGEATVNLVPNTNYKIFLTKTGYIQTGSNDWKPEAYSIYDPPETKIFTMNYVDIDADTQGFWDICLFNATLHENGSLYVYYEDTDEKTINAQFYTDELYNFTTTQKSLNTTTSSNYFFWVTGLNISRTHRVTIHLNHTTIDWVNISILISPYRTPDYTKEEIEGFFVGVFGDYTLGYVNFFLIFIPMVMLLILFGPKHAGLGIIGAGLYMGFSSLFIAVPPLVLGIAPFIVALGLILIMTKKKVIDI